MDQGMENTEVLPVVQFVHYLLTDLSLIQAENPLTEHDINIFLLRVIDCCPNQHNIILFHLLLHRMGMIIFRINIFLYWFGLILDEINHS